MRIDLIAEACRVCVLKYEALHCINRYSGKNIELPINLRECFIEIDGKEIKYEGVISADIAISSPIFLF